MEALSGFGHEPTLTDASIQAFKRLRKPANGHSSVDFGCRMRVEMSI